MKTKVEWDELEVSLDDYMPEPCEIDEDLYEYIGSVVPPYYVSQTLTQGGDAEDRIKGDDGEYIYTYMTVSEVNGKYFYLGILPEFRQ